MVVRLLQGEDAALTRNLSMRTNELSAVGFEHLTTIKTSKPRIYRHSRHSLNRSRSIELVALAQINNYHRPEKPLSFLQIGTQDRDGPIEENSGDLSRFPKSKRPTVDLQLDLQTNFLKGRKDEDKGRLQMLRCRASDVDSIECEVRKQIKQC